MKKASLILISLLYIIAGVNHFLNPAFYLEIMPNYIPVPLIMIYFSGVIEIILGLSLYNKKNQNVKRCLVFVKRKIHFYNTTVTLSICIDLLGLQHL